MGSFFKLFRGRGGAESGERASGDRVQRRSNGLAELTKRLEREGSGCAVLDLGPTSASNITFFTSLGQRTHTEDVLLASRDPEYYVKDESGASIIDPDKFLAENLNFEASTFDAVLCWDAPDYLAEPLVKPAVARIHKILKPGGVLLGFFHTKDAGPDAPYQRYHIAAPDTLDMQRIPVSANAHFRLQRIYNNRHIENLFRDYGSIKFFLGRDNIREVLVVR